MRRTWTLATFPVIILAVGVLASTGSRTATDETEAIESSSGGTNDECTPSDVVDSDCCTDGGNGGVGCDDPDCENLVCAADAFCCDTEWDGICADAAQRNCTVCLPSPPGTSDCCLPGGNGTPGCEDPACEARVCVIDSFCCDTVWDGFCAELANAQCAACGATDPDEDCTVTVCLVADDFPEETSWEIVQDGVVICEGVGGTPGVEEVTACAVAEGEWTFTIFDTFGDGICCGFGEGRYVVQQDGEPICSGGEFGDQESCTTFCGPGPPCAPNEDSIEITITLDDHPEETVFVLFDDQGNLLASGGPFPPDAVGTIESLTCTCDGCAWIFLVYDSGGNGLCCDTGEGGYTLEFNGQPACSGGEFEFISGCVSENCDTDPPLNALCVNAEAVAIDSSTPATTLFSLVQEAPDCGTDVLGIGAWFTVVGDGTALTASLCNDGTDGPFFIPKISVYCGDCPELGEPVCVGGNDGDPACPLTGGGSPLPSVTWCSQPGATYRILVHGLNFTSGNFTFDVTGGDAPCAADVQCLPTGACCLGSSCIETDGPACTAQGGTFLGDGVACIDATDTPGCSPIDDGHGDDGHGDDGHGDHSGVAIGDRRGGRAVADPNRLAPD